MSVTSSCGFGCVYCAPGAALNGEGANGSFLSAELLRKNIHLLARKIPLKEIHFTGGEPTLHKDLPKLVKVAKEEKIPNIALTSNGFFRDGLIRDLKLAGLDRLNFSLDSLSQESFL